jgi:hypothetical protein
MGLDWDWVMGSAWEEGGKLGDLRDCVITNCVGWEEMVIKSKMERGGWREDR